MDGWKGHRSRRTGNFINYNHGCAYKRRLHGNKLYRKVMVTGMMVDLGEITSQDPDPRRDEGYLYSSIEVEDTSADVL